MAVTAEAQRDESDGGTRAGSPAQADGVVEAGLIAALGRLGPARLAVLGLIGIGLLGFFAFIIGRAVQSPETLLFGGLESADARQIVERLDSLGVSYRLSASGDAVMVPADEAPRLRMALAEDGLPAGGVIGYELFDQSSALGQTDFLSNVNLRRALEGELARTISSLRPVRAARVHLVQPERGVFRRDATPPSASIALTLRGGQRLEPRQIQAIVNLVAAAVPGLDAGRVTLVDDRGELLARGDGGALAGALGGDAEERRVAIEEHLKSKIVQLLERTVGAGKVDAEVSVDLDLQQVTTTAETFDPNGQVARSQQTVDENSQRSERDPNDSVSVANNLPTEAATSGTGPGSNEATQRTEETVNYEVSRTVRSETQAPGGIKRLGIAVQVDGLYEPGPDGAPVFKPLPEADLAQLAALVRSAAGVDEERGDVVEVVSRPFVQIAAPPAEEPSWLDLDAATTTRLIELTVLSLLTLAVALLVVRPAVSRLLSLGQTQPVLVRGPDGRPLLVQTRPDGAITVEAADTSGTLEIGTPRGTAGRAGVAGDETGVDTPASGAGRAAQEDDPNAVVTIENVAGDVQASLVKDVSELVETRPQDVIRTIRSWLAE